MAGTTGTRTRGLCRDRATSGEPPEKGHDVKGRPFWKKADLKALDQRLNNDQAGWYLPLQEERSFFELLWLAINASHNHASSVLIDKLGYLYIDCLLWRRALRGSPNQPRCTRSTSWQAASPEPRCSGSIIGAVAVAFPIAVGLAVHAFRNAPESKARAGEQKGGPGGRIIRQALRSPAKVPLCACAGTCHMSCPATATP
jgi:hypothetical protein